MSDTKIERPLFKFRLRPWKVQKAIQSTEACRKKHGKKYSQKKQNWNKNFYSKQSKALLKDVQINI